MKLLTAFSLFVTLWFSISDSEAQDALPSGSRAQALAGASVCLADCWSVFGNQAGVANINRVTIGGSFHNRFLIKELSSGSGFIIFPVQSSVFALSVFQYGKTSFRHEKLGILFARSINPRLNFGLQFTHYRFFLAEENRSIGSYGMELGFQFQANQRLLFGLHALNPYQIRIKTLGGKYSYPQIFNFGAYYKLSESFGMVSSIEKNLSHPVNVKTGLEYSISDRLFIRTGISGKPYQLSAGMGFSVKSMKIDMAVAYNQYLGNSPSVSFQYQFR